MNRNAVEVVAGFDALPVPCEMEKERDAVVLRLDRSLGTERGWARVRAETREVGSWLPTLHYQPSETPPEAIAQARESFLLGQILSWGGMAVLQYNPDDSSIFDPDIEIGSSGGGLFDEDGYVIATVQGPVSVSGIAAVEYVSLEARINNHGLELAHRTEHDRFAVGRFTDAGFDTGFTHGTRGMGMRARANALALAPSGRYIAAGFRDDVSETELGRSRSAVLVAYQANGSEDAGFGTDGIVERPIVGPREELHDVVVRGADEVLAAGTATAADGSTRALVLSWNSTGDVTSFGASHPNYNPGFQGVQPDSNLIDETGRAIALDDMGRVVVAGHGRAVNALLGFVHRPYVSRMLPDGSADPTCNQIGTFTWDDIWASADARQIAGDLLVQDAALSPSGDIILVGYAHVGTFRRQLWVGKLRAADCQPDTTFGPDGSGVFLLDSQEVVVPDGHLWAEAVTVDQLGRVLVAGGVSRYVVARGVHVSHAFVLGLDPDGAPALGFGELEGGLTILPLFFRWHEVARDILVSGDSIVLVGESRRHVSDADVARMFRVDLSSSGAVLDDSHVTSGSFASSTDEFAAEAVVNSDGDIVVVGASREND